MLMRRPAGFWAAGAGFTLGWELDFWGKFKRGIESADRGEVEPGGRGDHHHEGDAWLSEFHEFAHAGRRTGDRETALHLHGPSIRMARGPTRGVSPAAVLALKSAPPSMSAATAASLPRMAALCSGVKS